MTTTTPKRKRGQHAKRHPWSNAGKRAGLGGVGPIMREADFALWDAWNKWRNTMDINGWSDRDKRLTHGAFMAGYRAGKAAK